MAVSTPYPPTHQAVVTPGKRLPLEVREVPTVAPDVDEIVIHVEWTSSSPLELHQADGGLLTTPDFILGSTFAGTIVAIGPEDPDTPKPQSAPLKVGDRVIGFARERKRAGYQTYVTVSQHMVSLVPPSMTLEAAVTVPTNLITAFHTITHDLGLPLPWPIPENWAPESAEKPILIWGAASSVGYYTIQVLRLWGYKNVIAVASAKHHEELKKLGAKVCFDYRDEAATDKINGQEEYIPYIVDCIGHVDGTLRPLTRVAKNGSIVAIMMPAIIRDATVEVEPLLSMDPSSLLTELWAPGVKLIGVRTFFYEKNEFFKVHLQRDIIPSLLEDGLIQPNKQRIVEGATLLERATKALAFLRERAPSGERLVWRVDDE